MHGVEMESVVSPGSPQCSGDLGMGRGRASIVCLVRYRFAQMDIRVVLGEILGELDWNVQKRFSKARTPNY